MADPYSYDLRKKVLQAIQVDKMGKTQASRIFNISRNTIDLWLKRQTETGDFKARSHAPKQSTAKIQDLDAFRAFVDQYGDKTQGEMALLWSQIYGVTLSATTIGNTFRRINVTRKKKHTGTRNARKKNGKNSAPS
jgi:transposase